MKHMKALWMKKIPIEKYLVVSIIMRKLLSFEDGSILNSRFW